MPELTPTRDKQAKTPPTPTINTCAQAQTRVEYKKTTSVVKYVARQPVNTGTEAEQTISQSSRRENRNTWS